ncbi:YlbE-like family protein [Litchfieldia alkalitelluris]|uniref:YlbE-like family protein n=1 Tax=Litchfieldia alkalitelluris TaxID=304268 RepID=UPI000998A960|nr:YlbE-like family protein [Litchfieldia alkalitelluris]
MRRDVVDWLQNDKKLNLFVRHNPIWYRKLSRNPHNRQQLELHAKNYYKQTIPHKVEKFSNSLGFASMMMEMYKAMRNGD